MFRGGGIPFMFPGGGFPGGMPGGGMPGGMGGDDDSDTEIDTTALYETLRIEKTATTVEIKKAYHKIAKKEHPDKGGDPEKFKEVTKAYSILSDPEKRAVYDEHGEKGLERGGGPDADDMMRMFFGGGARRPRGPRKAEATMVPLRCTLAEIFSGFTRTVPVTTTELTDDPEGNVMDRSTGKRFSRKAHTTPMEVTLERGMKHGQRITIPGKGDIMPGATQGDVVFVVQETNHPVFNRKGADLVMKKTITLREALTGVCFVVEHLDGHKVFVRSAPGQVIKPDTVMQVADEGMPVYGSTFVRGCLFVQFEITFPDTLDLSEAISKVFASVLPGPTEPVPALEEGMVEGVLAEADMDARRERERLAREAYDSDEEGGGAGVQGVQCAHQ